MQTSATTDITFIKIVGILEPPTVNWRFIEVPPWRLLTLYGVTAAAWVSAITWGGYRGAYWLLSS